jgi:D-aminopeptidase
LATTAHDGIARAVFPSHTSFDGDLIFSVSTGNKDLSGDPNEILMINHAASLCVSRAIARGVYHATNSGNDLFPSFQRKFCFKA